jgi:hypothetical protein
MPFGLDIKSLLVGALFVWFVLPWIMSMLNRPKAPAAA